jgi:hypothetical protein
MPNRAASVANKFGAKVLAQPQISCGMQRMWSKRVLSIWKVLEDNRQTENNSVIHTMEPPRSIKFFKKNNAQTDKTSAIYNAQILLQYWLRLNRQAKRVHNNCQSPLYNGLTIHENLNVYLNGLKLLKHSPFRRTENEN